MALNPSDTGTSADQCLEGAGQGATQHTRGHGRTLQSHQPKGRGARVRGAALERLPGNEREPSHRLLLSPPHSCLSSAPRSLPWGSREAWHSHTRLLTPEGKLEGTGPWSRREQDGCQHLCPTLPWASSPGSSRGPHGAGTSRLLSLLRAQLSDRMDQAALWRFPKWPSRTLSSRQLPRHLQAELHASFLFWRPQSRAPIPLAADSRGHHVFLFTSCAFNVTGPRGLEFRF